jgi:serine protease AprX
MSKSNYDHPQLPSKIYAEALVRSATGQSLLRSPNLVSSENVKLFHSTFKQKQIAVNRLRASGFEVLEIGDFSINVAASPEIYERSFGSSLEVVQRPVVRELGTIGMAEFVNSADQSPLGEIDISGTHWVDILDGVAINEPVYFLRQSVPDNIPPKTNTRYLQVPDDLATELGATLAHSQGITGKGVRVVIIDSGCYAEHPFFKSHNYHLKVVLAPGSSHPEQDTNGHGTGIAANLLAIAPGVELTILKSDIALEGKVRNVNAVAAFRKAVTLGPDIISCSWGTDLRNLKQLSAHHKVLAATIADAVRKGIVVVFAAGNGQWGFPSQHPDVIAVGGVYKHLEGSLKGQLEASNYASSFTSPIYPGRHVPDVCGLVGRLPNAAYILLPVPPGSDMDRQQAARGDETRATDAWAAFSGTSAAAPQLAGACALLKELVPQLTPLKIKQILQETASDILAGSSNPTSGKSQARAGPDAATGHGLAVTHKAVQLAQKLRFALKQKIKKLTPDLGITKFNRNAPPEQNPDDLYRACNQGERIMSSLDESTLRKLRIKLDEIQVDLNSFFKKKYPALANEDIELAIYEGNFVESSPQSGATESLLATLRTVTNNAGKVVDKSRLRKIHISAAESLLKQNKCHSLAKELLVTAMTLQR